MNSVSNGFEPVCDKLALALRGIDIAFSISHKQNVVHLRHLEQNLGFGFFNKLVQVEEWVWSYSRDLLIWPQVM